jgi:biotin carboxyl carrier protein
MKMENELRAAAGGLVRAVLVGPGQAVEKGPALVELEAVHS